MIASPLAGLSGKSVSFEVSHGNPFARSPAQLGWQKAGMGREAIGGAEPDTKLPDRHGMCFGTTRAAEQDVPVSLRR